MWPFQDKLKRKDQIVIVVSVFLRMHRFIHLNFFPVTASLIHNQPLKRRHGSVFIFLLFEDFIGPTISSKNVVNIKQRSAK